MGWLGDVQSSEVWAAEPVTNAARAAGCVLLAPLCIASAAAGAGRELGNDARTGIDNARAGLGSYVDDLGENAERVIASTAGPLERASSLAMWTAIGLYAFVALAVIGTILFFFLR